MKKRLLSILLCLCMALSLLPARAAAVGADDLDTGLGFVLSGKSGDSITRAEMAKLTAYLALGSVGAGALKCVAAPFRDVDSENEYAPFIEYCCKSGFIKDMGNNSYAPDAPVTGYVAAKYLLCALGYGKSSDYTGSGWDLVVATDMFESGLNGGLNFNYNDNLTRLNAALMARNASRIRSGEAIADMDITVKSSRDDNKFSVSFTPKGGEETEVYAVYQPDSDEWGGAKVSIEFGDKFKADVTARDGVLTGAAVVLTPPQGESSVTIADTDEIANILAAAAGIGAAVLSVSEGKKITIPPDLAPQVLIAPEEGSEAAGLTAAVNKGLLSGLSGLGGALTIQADNDAARGALTLRGAGLDAAITQAGGNNNIEFRVQQVEEIYLSGNFGDDMGGRILPGTALRVNISAGGPSLNLGKSGGAAEVSLYPPAEIDPNLLMGVHSHNNSVTELYIQPDTAFADAMDKIERDESGPLVKPLKSGGTLDLTHFSAVGLVLANWADVADTSWYSDASVRFTLTTAAQLAGLAKLVNGGNDFEGKTITLGGSIDLSGANWTPIGDENHSFRGTFDGGGKTVSSLTIASASAAYAALFGECDDARIENLTVSGRVTGGANYAAGLVAMAKCTHIENCRSSVEIDITGDGAADYCAGGIAAYLQGANLKTIVGCSNSGDISVTNAYTAHVGGIVGRLWNDRVYNCENTGNVAVPNAINAMVGGIAGRIYKSGGTAFIANCYSVADITHNGSLSIVPSAAGAMYNCYAYSNTVARGAYYNGFSSVSDIENAEALKALVSTLNAWVKAPTVTLDTTAETPFAPWYTSAQYSGGYPCFTRYAAPPEPVASYGTYVITATAGEHGSLSPLGRVFVLLGSDKRFSITPESGCRIYDVLVDGTSVGPVSEYLFGLVRGDHRILALFAPAFEDVGNEWFAPDVDYAAAWGLMTGIGSGLFGPDRTVTRGMMAAVLWRMEGEPAATAPMAFTDVPAEKYYHDAVAWAAEHALVLGYDALTFGPDDSITREQLAAIVWRYAQHKGYDVSVAAGTNILSYADAPAVSGWALPAMGWACGTGLIRGDGGSLTPQGSACRAQLAAILHRFLEKAAPLSPQAEA